MSERSAGNGVVDAALEAWAAAGRHSRVPVSGMSMAPLLRPGDVAVVAHGRHRLRIGEVLAYRSAEGLIVHRLVGRRRDGSLLLAGDGRPIADAPLPRSAVVGRVVAVEHDGRRFGLEGAVARALGWAMAACFPVRRQRGLRMPLAWLARGGAWLVRRGSGGGDEQSEPGKRGKPADR